MASLSARVEEIEEELYEAQGRARDYEEENSRLKDEVSDLEDQVAEHEEYIEWFEETYPEARTAYDAKQRLDQAA